MNNVMLATCRSYSAQHFDGCDACVDSALDAVTQASLYLMARSSLDESGLVGEPKEIAYSLAVSLCDDGGRELGSDEIEVEQTISGFEVAGEGDVDDAEADGDDYPQSSMRLEDFQTVIDKLELGPDDEGSLRGVIVGRVYAYGESIGLFEVAVAAGA